MRNSRHPLRLYRNESVVTQEELAKKLGITAAHISRLETGERETSPALAIHIEKKLGIPKTKLRPDIWD